MAVLKIYDAILDGHDERVQQCGDIAAEEYANGIVWSECETREHNVFVHTTFINTVNNVDIHYCYGADHYLFCPAD